MKNYLFTLICLAAAALPLPAAAQANIRQAFQAIIKCPKAQVFESHSLEKDPVTKVKIGQCDIYNFTLPTNKEELITKVIDAFEKDSQTSYSTNRGTCTDEGPFMSLFVGQSEGTISITEPGADFAYALFLPSKEEDKTGNYRYAYGICYKQEYGKITGRIVITYSTTLKYRQEQEKQRQEEFLQSHAKDSSVLSSYAKNDGESWFETIMSYFQSMTSASAQTRIALATKAFKLISNPDKDEQISVEEKNAVREVLKAMISDKKYSETILNRLLNQCLVALK